MLHRQTPHTMRSPHCGDPMTLHGYLRNRKWESRSSRTRRPCAPRLLCARPSDTCQLSASHGICECFDVNSLSSRLESSLIFCCYSLRLSCRRNNSVVKLASNNKITLYKLMDSRMFSTKFRRVPEAKYEG